MKHPWGIWFIDTYYHYSPIFINKLEDHPKMKFIAVEVLIKPILFIGYTVQKVAKFILKNARGH